MENITDSLPPGDAAFRLDRLTIAYESDTVPTIDNFNLEIRANEITCILGRSGCGKTTLLKALGGFLLATPTGGVLFEGRWLEAPTPTIVMIFQENNLFPWLNVRQNVGFGLRFTSQLNLLKRERTARVDAILEQVGLSEAANLYPHQLSGGMRQRTAIARALVTDPRVLLLDEPFSALDIGLRRRMHALMRNLWEQTGKTMVMITHNIEEAILVGHRVIVLGDRPARVLADIDTRAPNMQDRYAPAFLDLQRRLETYID